MKRIPSIKSVMTPFPYHIEVDADIQDALIMMEEHNISHLPVTEDGKLVGMLWQGDIRVARELEANLPTAGVAVGKVCNREPYVVEMDERLDHVVLDMANRRDAAAIVMFRERLAGILTTSDVCRLLGETLRAQFHVPDDDGGDAA